MLTYENLISDPDPKTNRNPIDLTDQSSDYPFGYRNLTPSATEFTLL
jgi:hypothetical protein